MVKLSRLQKPSPGAALLGKKLSATLNVTDFSGKTSTLASHLGKPTFISFWASWCGPCLKEMPELNTVLGAHKGEFQVIAIAMGDQLAAAVQRVDLATAPAVVIVVLRAIGTLVHARIIFAATLLLLVTEP